MDVIKSRKNNFSLKETLNNPAKTYYNCSDIYVLAVSSISNLNVGPYYETKCISFYLLGLKKGNEYYELFSGAKLNNECEKFCIPYIERVEPLQDYLSNPKLTKIDSQLLFEFLSILNTNTILEMLSNENEKPAQSTDDDLTSRIFKSMDNVTN